MFRKKQSTKKESDGIFNIPPYLIKPNPTLSRTEFSDTALCSLADSIRRYGMLQPLAVRLSECGRYELIAGERRLRAAVLLGMSTVPCVLVENLDNFEFLSVVENLQREGLGMFDEARAIKRLHARSGGNIPKTARLLSISEGELTRKLRLTELSRAEAQAVIRLGLSESTAVQLLRIPPSVRFYAIKLSAERGLSEEVVMKLCEALEALENPTVELLEEAVESLTVGSVKPSVSTVSEEVSDGLTVKRSKGVIRDMRIFENSLRRSVELLRSAGCEAELDTSDGDGETVYRIRVRM